jgi:hypothetical protein
METDEVVDRIRAHLKGADRAFFVYYYPNKHVYDAMKSLRDSGFLADSRTWRFSGLVTLVAAILDPKQGDWLRGLPDPVRPWGPAGGDTRFNPLHKIPTAYRKY